MKENEETKIQYQFTASPLNLMYVLDSDCLKMLNLLIQEDSYWRSQGQLKDGYFFKSINDLKDDMFMANDQDVRLTIDALYINGIIDVINQGDRHNASKFKINVEKIAEIDSKSILEVKKFYPIIRKFQRGHSCSYMKRKDCTNVQKSEVDNASDISKVPGSATNFNTDCGPTCTPKLDKSDLLNKSDSLNKIDNNIINNNIINNVDIEKESFHHLNIEIDDKGKGFVDINDQEVTDASAPSQVAAHCIDSTNIYTKEELLISRFNQAYKEMGTSELESSMNNYTTEELKYIQEQLPALGLRHHGIDGYITYLICIRKRAA